MALLMISHDQLIPNTSSRRLLTSIHGMYDGQNPSLLAFLASFWIMVSGKAFTRASMMAWGNFNTFSSDTGDSSVGLGNTQVATGRRCPRFHQRIVICQWDIIIFVQCEG